MVTQEYLFMKEEGLIYDLSLKKLYSMISTVSFRDNIIGLVNIRDFALLDTESGKFTVRNIMNFYKHRYGTAITTDDSSYDVFNLFKKGNNIRKKYRMNYIRYIRELCLYDTRFCFV